MSSARIVPALAQERQRQASDPETSAFVSANAGSGKTYVLVNRVIRLLLSGVSPEKILCVTFTKAAAANMAERVFTRLGQWVTLDDAALDREIIAVGIDNPTSVIRSRARELFACALETPGGLKVQTIHALCTRLLQQFPFEANVPARFNVLDDRDQAEMMERGSLAVLLHAANDPESRAGRALRVAMTTAADMTFQNVIREATFSRDKFLAWINHAGSVDAAMAQLSTSLGLAADDTLTAIETDIVDGPHLPRRSWIATAQQLEAGTVTDGKQGLRLREALTLEGSAQVDDYLSVFLTEKLEPRKSLVTKKLGDANAALRITMDAEAHRLEQLLPRRRAAALRERTFALLVIATSVAESYQHQKNERGLLDYDDLIDKTLQMLNRVSSSWVHYKLDRGVDHVLIDEAQDTSPRQWDILAHLISEFTSGDGARDGVKRTIFAVGDEKQSIFSFQGAVPREFNDRNKLLSKQFTGAKLQFAPISFTTSFRTGAAILQSVDFVFREKEIYQSIHAEEAYPVHQSLSDAGPSLIDLWELERPDDRLEMEGWQAPFDASSETSPEARLALRVRDEIRSLIATDAATGPQGKRRKLRYGDILILVRRRGKAFNTIIQALKHASIPVAGADRLKLTEHIAIIDLMNLADALLLPQDDLALAIALKSPIFGLDDDDLFKIAWEREGSLREALRRHADSDPKLLAAETRLRDCERHHSLGTPFTFYAWLLGGQGGRARILKRLGHEANDALDEFLELALSYERKSPGTLQGFVTWLRAADTEVKRDMEISRDEVRVMTVHGAKGLEAPVVFMVDTTSSPSDSARISLLHLPPVDPINGGPGVVVWAGKQADDPPAVAEARAKLLAETEDEYRRLLYVAMTRAADRLIIGGCLPGNRKEVKEKSWYDLIAKGLAASGLNEEERDGPSGRVKRYTRAEDLAPDGPLAATTPIALDTPALPDWLHQPLSAEKPPLRVLRPSDAGSDEVHHVPSGDPDLAERARQRGILAHRLLQSLPGLGAEQRLAAALDFLSRNAKAWTSAERVALAEQVLAVIAEPSFAAVFAGDSRAEVSIVGKLTQADGQPVLVSGQIDRLVITPDEVLIVDYKTNQDPPATVEAAPIAYIRQLALYRALLAKLYPDRVVRAALLWTATPALMPVPTSALDAGLETAL